jgi:hypothetical protein
MTDILTATYVCTFGDFSSIDEATTEAHLASNPTHAIVVVHAGDDTGTAAVDFVDGAAGAELAANKGQANGYAGLDGGGKVPVAQLPNAILTYKGTWNALTNTPTLVDGTGSAGDVYRVSVEGTQDLGSGSRTWHVGDYAIYNTDDIWEDADTTDAVSSVNTYTGAVVLDKSDIGLGNVTNDAQVKASDRDTDGTLAANSATRVPSQSAVKTYADTKATDTLALHKAGSETVTGTKTFEGALAATVKIAAQVTADTFSRFQVQSDGQILWGDGSGAADVNLYRASSTQLKTDDSLYVVGGLQADANVQFGGSVVSLSGSGTTLNVPNLSGGTQGWLTVKAIADSQNRFTADASGKLVWGAGGVTAPDTNLYRNASNSLKTDDNFDINGKITLFSSGSITLADTAATISWSGSTSPSTTVLDSRVLGAATFPSFDMKADGKMEWGSGTLTVDTELSRYGTNRLGTTSGIVIKKNTAGGTGLDTDSGLVFRNSGDTLTAGRIYNRVDNAMGTDGNWTHQGNHTFNNTLKAASNIDFTAQFVDLRTQGSASSVIARTNVSGDTQSRLAIQADGKILWGSGAAVADVSLERTAVGILAVGATHKIQQNAAPTVGDDLVNKTYADLKATDSLVVHLAGAETITGLKTFEGALVTDIKLQARVPADAQPRFAIQTDGKLKWTGGAIVDSVATLYRASAGKLQTDGAFQIDGLATLGVVQAGGTISAPNLSLTSPGSAVTFTGLSSATGITFQSHLSADTFGINRFELYANGTLNWGAGAVAPDVTLSRTAANIISMGSGDKIQQNAAPTVGDDLVNKTYADSVGGGAAYVLQPVRVMQDSQNGSNISIATAPASVDGVTLTSGDRVGLFNQTTTTQNGIWVFNGTGSAFTRPTDFPAGGTARPGTAVWVLEGTTYLQSWAILKSTGTITIDTTAQLWVSDGSPSFFRKTSGLNNIRTDGTLNFGNNLTIDNGGNAQNSAGSGGFYNTSQSSATNTPYKSKLSADTQYRYAAQVDGKLLWGAGGVTAPDTNLYRSGADNLKTDDSFNVGSFFNVSAASGSITLSNGGGSIDVPSSTSATTITYESKVSGDTQYRFIQQTGGKLQWGPGGATAPDVTLERTATGILAVGATHKIQQNAAPTVGDDLVNKTYADNLVGGATVVHIAGTETITGTKTFSSALKPTAGIEASTTGITDNIVYYNVVGEAASRFVAQTNGRMRWGNGTLTQDVAFSRTAADILAMDAGDKWQQNAAPTVGDDLTNKTYVDSKSAQTVPASAVKVASYTLTTSDYLVPFDSTAAIRTATLPTAPANGTTFIIKDGVGQAGTSNIITVAAGGADTIDGLATRDLVTDWEAMTITYHAATTNWLRS